MKNKSLQIHQLIRESYEERNALQIDSEIISDIRNLHMIKKMINRFLKSKCINDRLLVNNVVITVNTLGVMRSNRVFNILLNESESSIVVPILKFLSSYYPSVWVNSNVMDNETIRGILNDSIFI